MIFAAWKQSAGSNLFLRPARRRWRCRTRGRDNDLGARVKAFIKGPIPICPTILWHSSMSFSVSSGAPSSGRIFPARKFS
jgi:hypothetical protein